MAKPLDILPENACGHNPSCKPLCAEYWLPRTGHRSCDVPLASGHYHHSELWSSEISQHPLLTGLSTQWVLTTKLGTLGSSDAEASWWWPYKEYPGYTQSLLALCSLGSVLSHYWADFYLFGCSFLPLIIWCEFLLYFYWEMIFAYLCGKTARKILKIKKNYMPFASITCEPDSEWVRWVVPQKHYGPAPFQNLLSPLSVDGAHDVFVASGKWTSWCCQETSGFWCSLLTTVRLDTMRTVEGAWELSFVLLGWNAYSGTRQVGSRGTRVFPAHLPLLASAFALEIGILECMALYYRITRFLLLLLFF